MRRSSPTTPAEGAIGSICGGMEVFIGLFQLEADMLRAVTVVAMVLEIRTGAMAPESRIPSIILPITSLRRSLENSRILR